MHALNTGPCFSLIRFLPCDFVPRFVVVVVVVVVVNVTFFFVTLKKKKHFKVCLPLQYLTVRLSVHVPSASPILALPPTTIAERRP